MRAGRRAAQEGPPACSPPSRRLCQAQVCSEIQFKLSHGPGTFRTRTARPPWRDSFCFRNDQFRNFVRMRCFQWLHRTGCGEVQGAKTSFQLSGKLPSSLLCTTHPHAAPPQNRPVSRKPLRPCRPDLHPDSSHRLAPARGEPGSLQDPQADWTWPLSRADSHLGSPPRLARGQHRCGALLLQSRPSVLQENTPSNS